MSLSFKVEQSGLDIKILADRFEVKILQPLILALAEVAERVMREKAPRRTGRLASSIYKTVGGLEAAIGPRAPYAIFVEMGARPHEILPVHARALRFEVGGRVFFAMRVSHPGARPKPFVRETAQIIRDEADEVFENVWRSMR